MHKSGTVQGKEMHHHHHGAASNGNRSLLQANRCASNASTASEILFKRRGRDGMTITSVIGTDENRLLFARRGGMLTSEMKPSKSDKIQINPM